MARQHINSYKNTEWDYITFSDIDTVRGLLKFRSRFDLLYERQNNNILSSDFDLASLKEDVICIYADLDRLIEKARLNDVQKEFIELYMKGYTEKDIAEIHNRKEVTVNSTINSACKKIVEANFESWKLDYIFWNIKRVDSNFKQCTKCKEYLPATGEYFSPDLRNKDGLQAFCKKCNAERMKN